MKAATLAQVRAAFLAMVYRQTQSLSLTRDCKNAFDEKRIDTPLNLV